MRKKLSFQDLFAVLVYEERVAIIQTVIVVLMFQRTVSNSSTDGGRRPSLMSMAEYDTPNIKRLSVSAKGEEMESDK